MNRLRGDAQECIKSRILYHGPMKMLTLVLLLLCNSSRADLCYVAVAANFSAPAREITKLFKQASGHQVKLSFGSTGKLFTQISQGAPFQVFLAADSARPERLEAEGQTVAGSRFTYALGQLALYSADPNMIDGTPAVLTRPDLTRVAIANPTTAPYGAASIEVMQALKVYGSLRDKLVRGENIAQAWQFVATGNAPLGFVAVAQLNPDLGGSWWLVPDTLHSPIRQQAVLLRQGEGSTAAQAFYRFLKQPPAGNIIRAYGYRLESG